MDEGELLEVEAGKHKGWSGVIVKVNLEIERRSLKTVILFSVCDYIVE